MGYPFLETTTWFKFHQTCPGGAVNSWASLEATWMLGHVKSGKWQGKKRGKKPDLDWTWFFTWFFTCERGSVSDLVFQSVSISFNPQIVRIIQNGLLWVDNFGPKVFVHLSRAFFGSPTLEGPLPRSQLQQVFRHQLLLDLKISSKKKNAWMMVNIGKRFKNQNESNQRPQNPSDPRDIPRVLSVRLLQSKPSRAWMALTASSCACSVCSQRHPNGSLFYITYSTLPGEVMLNFVQFCLQRWHPMTNGLPCLAKFNQEMAWKAAVATMPRELIAPAALVSKLGHCKMIEARKQVSNLLILPNTS